MEEMDDLGPIDVLTVEFPEARLTGPGFEGLIARVDRDVVRVLDPEFVARQADGSVGTVAVSEPPAVEGFDLTVFDGACSGILDQSDIDAVGAAIAPGSVAAILVYEERSMIPVISAWELTDAEFDAKKAQILAT